ncbi:MAG: Unknown protein, partial [uncultured Aureispira sp.]
MSTFKNQLQDLLDICRLYKQQAPIENDQYTKVAEVVEILETAIKSSPTADKILPPSEIEALAAELNCLLVYDTLTKRKYEKWANTPSSFSSRNTHKALLDK